MSAPLTITTAGIPFSISSQLRQWAEEANGASYWFLELQAIVTTIGQATLGSPIVVHRVELHGVAGAQRVYAKLFNCTTSWQEEWMLQFGRKGKQLSRIG